LREEPLVPFGVERAVAANAVRHVDGLAVGLGARRDRAGVYSVICASRAAVARPTLTARRPGRKGHIGHRLSVRPHCADRKRVFDPERDEESGARRFYVRLLAVAAVTVVACAALWPSVRGFTAGPDHLTGCLAITDGWHLERSAPDLSTLSFPAPPTDAMRNDPAAMARWQAEWRASQARPEVQQAIAYADWKDKAGACVHESRHRLIVSGVGVGAIAFVLGGIAVGRSIRVRARFTVSSDG
jgi:hypothetical protein